MIDNTLISKNAQNAIASVNLSFDKPPTEREQANLVAMFQRIESGQKTHEQEEERLLSKWKQLKSK